MNMTWELLVDYARGLASPEVVAAVEADPEARRRAGLLRSVQASHESVSEWNLNRAKALIPILPETKAGGWKAVLGFDSAAGLAFGLRSAGTSARDLQYQFEAGTVELRLEPGVLIGMVEWQGAEDRSMIEIRAESANGNEAVAWCQPTGEFDMEIDTESLVALVVSHRLSGERVEIALREGTE